MNADRHGSEDTNDTAEDTNDTERLLSLGSVRICVYPRSSAATTCLSEQNTTAIHVDCLTVDPTALFGSEQ